jgi:general secretion pathway protein K
VSDRKSQAGFVLIVVLMFVVLLAGILAAMLRASSSFVSASVVFSDQARANELARSAPDLVAQRVLAQSPEARRGGAFSVHLSDAEVDVNYLSESARIDVNTAPVALIVALFRAAGLDSREAEAIGEKIKAWRGKPGSSGLVPDESSDDDPTMRKLRELAAMQASLSTAGEHRIDHESEIANDWGISSGLLKHVMSSLTVANPSGKVDPSLANGQIIQALFIDNPLQSADFLQRRSRGFTSETEEMAAIPTDWQSAVAFAPGKIFRARVRIRVSNHFVRDYEMVVAPPFKRGDDVKTIAWETK